MTDEYYILLTSPINNNAKNVEGTAETTTYLVVPAVSTAHDDELRQKTKQHVTT